MKHITKKKLIQFHPHINSTYVSEKINSTKTLQLNIQNSTFIIQHSKLNIQKFKERVKYA